MKNVNQYKGLVQISDHAKKRIKLRQDEEILFGIGEVRWIGTTDTFKHNIWLPQDHRGIFKNAIVTSKRIIIPMSCLLGYNIDYFSIFYDKISLDYYEKSFYKKYNFWINKYAVDDDCVLFDLSCDDFNAKVILFSSITKEIAISIPKEVLRVESI